MARVIIAQLRSRPVLTLGVVVVLTALASKGLSWFSACALPSFSAPTREVLHVQAIRNEAGRETFIEAWLDLASRSGKIVEMGPNGVLNDVESLVDGTHIHYHAERATSFAVIRRNVTTQHPISNRVRDRLLFPCAIAERGLAWWAGLQVLGQHLAHRNMWLVLSEGTPVLFISEFDLQTGLPLREEFHPVGGPAVVRTLNYPVIEYLPQSAVRPDTFTFEVPPDATVDEYIEAFPGPPTIVR